MLAPGIQNPWPQYIGHGNRTRHNLPCKRLQRVGAAQSILRFATTFRRGVRN